jgi:hypothetical protein
MLADACCFAEASTSSAPAPGSYRFGPFGLLDRRSTYGTFWFPEPLRSDEMDLDREIRLDYFHSESSGVQTNQLTAEVEWTFGLVTVEAEGGYQRETSSTFDPAQNRTVHVRTEAGENLNLSIRGPLFEWVVPKSNFDYTLAGGFEVGIPTGSEISKDTELVPSLFQLMRIGDHWSVQISTGFSFLIGPEEGGTNTLEANAIFGYDLQHEQLPLPGVLSTVPMLELHNQTTLSGVDSGSNSLFGTVGARFNLNSIGPVQPRLGLGYEFPIDAGARNELRWGVVVSLVFEL